MSPTCPACASTGVRAAVSGQVGSEARAFVRESHVYTRMIREGKVFAAVTVDSGEPGLVWGVGDHRRK